MALFQVAFSFQDTISALQEIGVFDFLLPFLLIFSIIFAALEKTKILGEDKTNINVIVSAIIGMLVLIQPGIIQTINLFLPRVSLIIVVVLMGLLVIAVLAGKKFEGLKGGLLSFAVIIALIAVVLALVVPDAGFSGLNISSQDRAILLNIGVPLLVFFIAIWLVTSKPQGKDKPSVFKKILDSIERG